jgi:hypothetical protein
MGVNPPASTSIDFWSYETTCVEITLATQCVRVGAMMAMETSSEPARSVRVDERMVWFGLRLKGLASKDPRPKAEAIAFAGGYVSVPR